MVACYPDGAHGSFGQRIADLRSGRYALFTHERRGAKAIETEVGADPDVAFTVFQDWCRSVGGQSIGLIIGFGGVCAVRVGGWRSRLPRRCSVNAAAKGIRSPDGAVVIDEKALGRIEVRE